MIVIDGDSVAGAVRKDVYEKHAWFTHVARARGVEAVNFCKRQSTARDCYFRLYKLHDLAPKWYFLMVGQWSQNHEPIDEFEKFLRLTVEGVIERGIKVCLLTPPKQLQYLGDTKAYADVIRKCARLYRTDIVDIGRYMEAVKIGRRQDEIEAWFEIEAVTCHFSHAGNVKIAAYFDLPENEHIGKA